jgi:hypothetical protein
LSLFGNRWRSGRRSSNSQRPPDSIDSRTSTSRAPTRASSRTTPRSGFSDTLLRVTSRSTRRSPTQNGRYDRSFGIKAEFTIPIRSGFGRIALPSLASERTEPDRVAISDETHAATAIAYAHINLVRRRDDTLQTADVALSPGRSRASTGRQ